jgi:hypothetical protein
MRKLTAVARFSRIAGLLAWSAIAATDDPSLGIYSELINMADNTL